MRFRPLCDVFPTVALAQEEGAWVGHASGFGVTLGFLGWGFHNGRVGMQHNGAKGAKCVKVAHGCTSTGGQKDMRGSDGPQGSF